jgi:hypothetical protein
LKLGEKSLNEIETQLPDDLLFDNNNIVSVFDGKFVFALSFKKVVLKIWPILAFMNINIYNLRILDTDYINKFIISK